MTGFARQKVSGGKLVSVRIEFGNSIERIEILGDFFVHPEEKLPEIEKGLLGIGVKEDEHAISERIGKLAKENGVEMIGVTPEAISSTIKMAISNGMASNKS